jgi:hypothetical protein
MSKEIKLNSLYIHPDLSMVEIKFTELRIIEDQTEEDGQRTIPIKRTIEAPLRPASALCDDLKSLRRHGLAIQGIKLEKEATQIKNWTVMRINIAGDMLTKKSRLTMTLAIRSELTGKITPLKVGQVTMYPKDDDKVKYEKAAEMTQLVEKIANGVWGYLNGEFDESIPGDQLVLYSSDPVLETNFRQ